VFQKLVASKAHDQDGLELLATLVESLEPAAYQAQLPTVWNILFTRLQTSRTPKYVRCLLVAVSR
jgi:exportin-2 (importin alpha re-exporter)